MEFSIATTTSFYYFNLGGKKINLTTLGLSSH